LIQYALLCLKKRQSRRTPRALPSGREERGLLFQMSDEQRRVALFQAQPEGLGLFLRPAALSFAHVA
ncbi:MAG: hypothetical protein JAZ18_12570, partial [Candidatus Thiodiazotropha endolucinida]|nr:hypothetical protein [Candidatus Thiodiazotropha endolucinida]